MFLYVWCTYNIALERRLGELNVQDLATALWTFAAKSYRDGKLFAILVKAAE